MKNRSVLLVVAAVLAAGAGLLTFNYLLQANNHVATSPLRPVVVAAADIPPHTTITEAMVRVIQRPTDDVDPGALSSPTDASGTTSLGPIPDGATITDSNTARSASEQIAGIHLPRGMRAVSIAVDEVRDVSGLLQPGDKVDVIAAPPRIGDAQPTAATILRDVTIVAVGGTPGQGTAPPSTPGTPDVPRSVTLAVSMQQADLLVMADLNATLRLALRPPGDPNITPEQLVFGEQTYASAPSAPSSASAPPPPPHPSYGPVEVIDGATITGAPASSGSGGSGV